MKRQAFAGHTCCLCFILLALFSCQPKKTEPSANADRPPNVLFILADDQRADALGCAGNATVATPNIDGLASEGIRFTNAYVMGGHHGAICAPSRAMLMTGKSLYHVYDTLDGKVTMPMYFERQGYETFGTGKWHNGAPSFEAGFQRGEAVFIGGMSNHFKTPVRQLGQDGKLTAPEEKSFSTDLFANAALDYLSRYAKGSREKPFLCYLAFTAPHDPRSPDARYVGRYEAASIPLPENFKPVHPFAFDDMQVRDENLAPWPRTSEMIRSSLADYYALITHLDERVGDIIALLKAEGLYENTLIVYAADNGLAIGGHGLLGKQNLYEHSTKVPLIIAGPGVDGGRTSPALVYLYDLFPTLAAMCDLPAPPDTDGISLLPVITGAVPTVRKSLLTVYRHTVRALRTDDWKIIRYPERDYTQLFHLAEDPSELNNLASLSEHRDKLEEMMTLLRGEQRLADDTLSLTAPEILPMDYDPSTFVQKPDKHQPEYVLKKYFPGD